MSWVRWHRDLNWLYQNIKDNPTHTSKALSDITGSQAGGQLLLDLVKVVREEHDDAGRIIRKRNQWPHNDPAWNDLLERGFVTGPEYIRVMVDKICKDIENKNLLPIDTLATGGVYLLKAGPFYKIGLATDFNRRIKEIAADLPDPQKNYTLEVIHTFPTFQEKQVEEYWQQQFANKRKNGEWFKLTEEDIARFIKSEEFSGRER